MVKWKKKNSLYSDVYLIASFTYYVIVNFNIMVLQRNTKIEHFIRINGYITLVCSFLSTQQN